THCYRELPLNPLNPLNPLTKPSHSGSESSTCIPMSTVSQAVDQPLPTKPPVGNDEARDFELATLEPLAHEVPNIDSAVANIARISAELTLPMGTIHVISDIHGEYKKLRHV